MKSTVPWRKIGDNDFKAEIKSYTLRVEKMGDREWWWRVYFKEEILSTSLSEFSSSKNRAMGLAEGIYFGHSLKR